MTEATTNLEMDRLRRLAPASASPQDDESREEKKDAANYGNAVVELKNQTAMSLHPQCDVVFESMEDCVGCIDGVEEQHTFEESLRAQSARQRVIADEHGLSEAEATIIRLQMIDSANDGIQAAVENTLTSITTNPLLFCGSGSLSHEDTGAKDILCEGVVNPVDTTLPTSLPGDALVESRQGKSSRSLVDVAETSETIHENIATADSNVQECAICNDSSSADDVSDQADMASLSVSSSASQRRAPKFLRLSCCESDGGHDNFKVCTACMIVLTVATNDGSSRVGRCPRCRSWISVNTLHSTCAVMDVRKLEASGKCETCLQIKTPLISEDRALCDACFLGKEVPLLYECEECHQSQTIGSTMYRSQPTATSVGNEMWPCSTCQKSTHWTIAFDQLAHIPACDVPEEWGNDFLELARSKVQQTRQGIAKLDLLGRDAGGNQTQDDACVMM
ncbi:MAG: hypothetical protein SGILL_008547 [Bacillariaceae sp.]